MARMTWGAALLAVLCWQGVAKCAAATPEEAKHLNEAQASLKQVSEHYLGKDLGRAVNALGDADKSLAALNESKDGEVKAAAGSLSRAANRFRRLLFFAGATFPEGEPAGMHLKPRPAPTVVASNDKPTEPEPAKPAEPEKPLFDPATLPKTPPKPATPDPAATTVAAGPSFLKEVAPIFIAKCGGCHINKSSGGFNLGTFAQLERGSSNGVVYFAGDGDGSQIVQMVREAQMPPNVSNRLSDKEVATIAAWIKAGAKYDGKDPQESIAKATPVAVTTPTTPTPTPTPPTPAKPATPAVAMPTGPSFSIDVAPMLAASCTGCHGGAQPRANLNLETFAALGRGGQNGALVVAGKPAESLLVMKLKGMGGGQRMPLNAPPIAGTVIAKIEKWIEAGAKFDGPDPATPVSQLARLVASTKMSPEQLTAERATEAAKNWSLAIPETPAETFESPNFLLKGNVNRVRLEEVASAAERVQPQVAAAFGRPSDATLVRGKITIYVFQRRFDYSEFGLTVERRELPKYWNGHGKFTGTDAYVALPPPADEEGALDRALAENLAAVLVESSGAVPPWFARGASLHAAAKVDSKSPAAKAYEAWVAEQLTKVTAPNAFMNAKVVADENEAMAYSFTSYLLKNAGQTSKLFDALQAKSPFEAAIQTALRTELPALYADWSRKMLRR